jgi:Fe2+ transport system protein FeoA
MAEAIPAWLTGSMEPVRLTTLDSLAAGATGVVAAIGREHASQLAREGIAPGSRLAIEAAAPFGGPLIVRVGRARVALARRVARTVELCPEPAGVP